MMQNFDVYNINAKLVFDALNFYKDCGYTLSEAPMIVSGKAVKHTLPKNVLAKPHMEGFYVGSAEQGFLQNLIDNNLKGSFCYVSPCQRNEKYVDQQHLEIFLKIELISTDKSYTEICEDAYLFMSRYREVYKQQTAKHSVDIVSKNNVEYGSYSSNCFMGREYCCGTGLALPRFNII